MKRQKRRKLKELCFSMMDSIYDPDMADGAMDAILQSQVDFVNEKHGTNFDPHDLWITWLRRRSSHA